jgi:hypothetical protein
VLDKFAHNPDCVIVGNYHDKPTHLMLLSGPTKKTISCHREMMTLILTMMQMPSCHHLVQQQLNPSLNAKVHQSAILPEAQTYQGLKLLIDNSLPPGLGRPQTSQDTRPDMTWWQVSFWVL